MNTLRDHYEGTPYDLTKVRFSSELKKFVDHGLSLWGILRPHDVFEKQFCFGAVFMQSDQSNHCKPKVQLPWRGAT